MKTLLLFLFSMIALSALSCSDPCNNKPTSTKDLKHIYPSGTFEGDSLVAKGWVFDVRTDRTATMTLPVGGNTVTIEYTVIDSGTYEMRVEE